MGAGEERGGWEEEEEEGEGRQWAETVHPVSAVRLSLIGVG